MTWQGPAHFLNLSIDGWRSLRAVYADQMARVPLRVRARYRVAGHYLSMLEGAQRRASATALATPPRQPVFILGHWRSGTTLLHELLACDRRFCFPDTYACMNPQHFVLTQRGALEVGGVRETQRPMDGMRVSSVSPQEDEFALLNLGARSPYEAMLFPHGFARAMQSLRWDTLDAAAQARWLGALREFLSLVAARSPDRTLLLKSPPHAFRFEQLRALFPDARFVHILRNPYHVADSTRRMWQELQGLYALTPPPHPDIFEPVVEVLADYARAVPERAPPGVAWHALRFEDLVADPVAQLASLYAALELGSFDAVRPAVQGYLDVTASHRPAGHRLSDADRDLVARRCSPLLARGAYVP